MREVLGLIPGMGEFISQIFISILQYHSADPGRGRGIIALEEVALIIKNIQIISWEM